MRHTIPPFHLSVCLVSFSLFVVLLPAPPSMAAATTDEGAAIFAKMCAECHGAKGEGVEDVFPDTLHGGRSRSDLVKIINDTMPDGEPEQVIGADAERVAEFIFQRFYSDEERARFAGPRIALSHLTVRQYLNAAADLLTPFVGDGQADEARGLKAAYFKSRSFRNDQKAFDRTDAVIDFDFSTGSPDPKIPNAEFSMQWIGSVIAEETGDYDFFLTTENGARLWVNDNDTPLIDAWVRSGNDIEHQATIRLLAGRVYPIRLDYFKYKGKQASVRLEWRPPHHVRQVIPRRCLSPRTAPPTLVVTTQFPPDDGSMGYERGTSVSEAWDRATTSAAVEIAEKVSQHIDTLARTREDSPDRETRVKEFCYRLAERAFRRPLSQEEKTKCVDRYLNSATSEAAVKRVVLRLMKSPYFLYLGVPGAPSVDYDVASRLAFGLWDSLPDRELLNAAAQRRLHTPDQIVVQATRMLDNPRTRTKVRYFLHRWLMFDRADDLSKDKKLFPDFDQNVASDLRLSLDMFLDDVVWSDSSDFRRFLLSDTFYVNQRLADFYQLPRPEHPAFQPIAAGADRSAGILTQPFLLTNLAYHGSSSPIHRGVFLARGVLGRALKPPPIAVAPLDPGEQPDLTTRQRVALQTKPEACQSCHGMINPLGFCLEQFDAVGRFRTTDNARPVDATGAYASASGDTVQFANVRELAEFIAQSDEAHASFVRQLFHNTIKQPVTAYGPDTLTTLQQRFKDHDFNIQKLLVEIMKIAAFDATKAEGTD